MDSPTPDEMLAQVRRIALSNGFAGSEPMRNVLLYLAEHAARHPHDSVKEVTLAMEALGKGTDYDPRTDSTVRVIASRLRAKLAEYYAQEGARDPVLIAIPKGSYSIVSTYCTPGVPSSNSSIFRMPVELKASRSKWLVLGIVAGFGIAAGFLPGFWAGRHSVRPPVSGASSRFWSHFLKGDPPIIVFSNPRFTGAPSVGMRYATESTTEPVHSMFTGVGEVIAVLDIARQLSVFGRDARVKRAQLFAWDDAHASDLILVGGQRQNLTMAQLPKLEKFNLKAYSEEPYRSRGAVRNETPDPGKELPYYFSSGDSENGLEYAIVALTQGVVPERRVLILAGLRTFGTQAAAEFVTNPASVAGLCQKLNVRDGSVPTFEGLLEVPIRGGTPLSPKLLLVHRRKDATADN